MLALQLGLPAHTSPPNRTAPAAPEQTTSTVVNIFPLRVLEPWPRLPREAVESPSLEIFQPHLAVVLCSLLWVTLLGQGVGLGDPRGPCQP